jgi:acyl transferase domain-containing protein
MPPLPEEDCQSFVTFKSQEINCTVRSDCFIDFAVSQKCTAIVEIGSSAGLFSLKSSDHPSLIWLQSLTQHADAWSTLLQSLAHLYTTGTDVDWAGFDKPYRREKVALPTYPFQRQKNWPAVLEAQKKSAHLVPSPHPLLGLPLFSED